MVWLAGSPQRRCHINGDSVVPFTQQRSLLLDQQITRPCIEPGPSDQISSFRTLNARTGSPPVCCDVKTVWC